MKIKIDNKSTEPINILDMPLESVGRVKGNVVLYVIRTAKNGDEWLRIWPSANPVGIQAGWNPSMEEWEVTLLPKGTVIEFKF